MLQKLIPHKNPWGPSSLWFYCFYCFECNILSCTSETLQDQIHSAVPTLSYIITSAIVGSWGDTHKNCVGQYFCSISTLHWISLRKGQPSINSIFLPTSVEDTCQALDLHTRQETKVLWKEKVLTPLSARVLDIHLNAGNCGKYDWTTAIPAPFKNDSSQDYASRAHQSHKSKQALHISLILPHSESPDTENRSNTGWCSSVRCTTLKEITNTPIQRDTYCTNLQATDIVITYRLYCNLQATDMTALTLSLTEQGAASMGISLLQAPTHVGGPASKN